MSSVRLRSQKLDFLDTPANSEDSNDEGDFSFMNIKESRKAKRRAHHFTKPTTVSGSSDEDETTVKRPSRKRKADAMSSEDEESDSVFMIPSSQRRSEKASSKLSKEFAAWRAERKRRNAGKPEDTRDAQDLMDSPPTTDFSEDQDDVGSSNKPTKQEVATQVIDLSYKCVSPNKNVKTYNLMIGGGFTISYGMIDIPATSGKESISYEGLSLKKSVTTKPDKDGVRENKELIINFPKRLIPNLLESIARFRHQINSEETPSPSLRNMMASGKSSFDLSECGISQIPKIKVQLDELFSISGETLTFQGKTTYDVLSFNKHPKSEEGKKSTTKKPFTLSVPFKLFNNVELAFRFIVNATKPTPN